MLTSKFKFILGTTLLIAGILFSSLIPVHVNAESSNKTIKYVVKKGDTLYLLSQRFNITAENILSMNSVLDPGNLLIGNVIILPVGDGVIAHKILKGETLWKVSRQYGTDVDAIASKNYIENPNMIYTGDILAIPEQKTKHELMALSKKTVEYLKKRDFQSISGLVHPVKGIRFSPYGYVDVNNNLTFSSSKVSNFYTDKKVYTWGAYDGSGEPINLKPIQYFDKFVYNVDFISANQISYNNVIGKGNTLVNQFDIYPGRNIIEYYLPGSEKYGYMDWNSLRLVYENYNGKWYLVGIIHDQWTI